MEGKRERTNKGGDDRTPVQQKQEDWLSIGAASVSFSGRRKRFWGKVERNRDHQEGGLATVIGFVGNYHCPVKVGSVQVHHVLHRCAPKAF